MLIHPTACCCFVYMLCSVMMLLWHHPTHCSLFLCLLACNFLLMIQTMMKLPVGNQPGQAWAARQHHASAFFGHLHASGQ